MEERGWPKEDFLRAPVLKPSNFSTNSEVALTSERGWSKDVFFCVPVVSTLGRSWAEEDFFVFYFMNFLIL